MTEVWKGSITIDDPAVVLNNLHLWGRSASTQTLPIHDATLRFLSFVHIPSIPLYLAAGPSLDVSTSDETTSTWLQESLLPGDDQGYHGGSEESWWLNNGGQSDRGILLGVRPENGRYSDSLTITEILLYAAVKPAMASLPTPPGSSSPDPEDGLQGCLGVDCPEIRVYALPLSSYILSQAGKATKFVASPTVESVAYFLPNSWNQPEVEQKVQQKRESLSSVFDDATQKRQKLKSRGGESISKAMAGFGQSTSESGLLMGISSETPEPYIAAREAYPARRVLSRASSMTSFASQDHTRPISRTGPSANGKRSSLQRVESAISPCDSPDPLDVDETYSQQNKAALSKVVMAGMRLHGLQQKKRGSKSVDKLESATALGNPSDTIPLDDPEYEYKLVYHQTFKAASFSLRSQYHMQVIPQETMRDVVDRLLTLFCMEQATAAGMDGQDPSAHGTDGRSVSNAFDKPSAKASINLLNPV